MCIVDLSTYWKVSRMLKRFLMALFISIFSLTPVFALEETSKENFTTSAVLLALNQVDSNHSLKSSDGINNSEISDDLTSVKIQNTVVKPETDNSEHSGWLLAFALLGFVMLSNRRGV